LKDARTGAEAFACDADLDERPGFVGASV